MILMKALSGSRLYGTARPDSDYDYRGVQMEPLLSLVGLDAPFGQHQYTETDDATGETNDVIIFGLRKFLQLALQSNPNILDILFTPPNKSIIWTYPWQKIYEQRFEFLSQRVRTTYIGYAHSQLHRIQQHRRWIENPPQKPPEQTKLGPNHEWTKYQEWFNNRNPARHALELNYGYDTKHASHLVRLLLQGKHLLDKNLEYTPELTGDDLRRVKAVLHGEYGYDELLAWTTAQFEILSDYESPLPKNPPAYKSIEKTLLYSQKAWINAEIKRLYGS